MIERIDWIAFETEAALGLDTETYSLSTSLPFVSLSVFVALIDGCILRSSNNWIFAP